MARYLGDGECRTKLRDEPLLVLLLSYVFEIYHKGKKWLKKSKCWREKQQLGTLQGASVMQKYPLGHPDILPLLWEAPS